MIITSDIIRHIVANDGAINAVTLVQFPNTPLLQERLDILGQPKDAMEHALSLRSAYALPFWEGLMSAQFEQKLYAPELLKEALHHNQFISTFELNRNELTRFDEYTSAKYENYGINSVVRHASGEIRHLVLLDFHLPNWQGNEVCAEQVIKLLGQTGYLLETNKSYHFVGDKLVTEKELKRILYQALLLSPIIDKNWIAHQLLEESCTLRVTVKEGRVPQLMKHIN